MADVTGNGNGLHEAHINIEALSGKVGSIESSLNETRTQFLGFQTEVRESFRLQSTQTSAQINALGDKIEKQGRESAISRQFSVSNFLTVSASVGGFLAIIGGALFYPMQSSQNQIAQDLKEVVRVMVTKEDHNKEHERDAKEFDDTRTATYNWISKVQARQQADEDAAVTQRQMLELKDKLDERYVEFNEKIKAVTARVETLDASLVKRPEIQAANEAQDKMAAEANRDMADRIGAIATSIAALRNDFNSISPLSNTIRDLQDRLAHVTSQK